MKLRKPRAERDAKPQPDVISFQSDLDALVGEPAPWLLRHWPVLAGALIFAVVGAAALTRIDIVVMASGRLVSEVPPVVLQPLGSAVLRAVHVRPGEAVAEGQVLAVLDPTFTEADRVSLQSQAFALAARRDRLEAELAGDWVAAGALADADDRLQGALQTERRLLAAARRAALTADLDAYDAALAAEREAGAGLGEQLAIARELEAMRVRLAADQIGSRLQELGARADRLRAEADLRGHAARLEEITHRRAARAAELDAFERDWQRQVLEELAGVRPELARVEEQLAKAERLEDLTQLRAPRAGIVLEVARRAPGSLMREGEPVVSLVPTDVPLIAEVTLRSTDVGRLQPGTRAEVKIDTFPWRRHGKLEGTLRAVSRESYPADGAGGTGPAMHRGQIELGDAQLAGLVGGAALLPGMTLAADLKIGTRSALGFFFEPLMRGLQESLREP